MDSGVIDCEFVKRGMCSCQDSSSLAILKQVQRVYEDRINHIQRMGGAKKLQVWYFTVA